MAPGLLPLCVIVRWYRHPPPDPNVPDLGGSIVSAMISTTSDEGG
jgi:hypothetical protein